MRESEELDDALQLIKEVYTHAIIYQKAWWSFDLDDKVDWLDRARSLLQHCKMLPQGNDNDSDSASV